jgi:secondary thiamine-phosphate synthase enzyme
MLAWVRKRLELIFPAVLEPYVFRQTTTSGKAGATGLLTLFLHHTSASLVIQENADPTVRDDLMTFFGQLVPEDSRLYRHGYEGPDDMPAHIKTVLTTVHLAIPVTDGKPDLGTWQGVYLYEHRNQPHSRRLTLHLVGLPAGAGGTCRTLR